MKPYYSFTKKESVLLLILSVILVFLTLAAGWMIGIMARSESDQKNTEITGQAVSLPSGTGKGMAVSTGSAPLPSVAGNIPGVAETKQISASVSSAKRDVSALVPASKSGGSASPSPAAPAMKTDMKTDVNVEDAKADRNVSSPEAEVKAEKKPLNEEQKTETVPGLDSEQPPDKPAEFTADTQERDKAGSPNIRFSVIADTFVVKTKALWRVNELKEKGYSQALILCFPASDRNSNMMNYLIQIGSYENLSAASLAASEFWEKEKSLAVIRPISLSDLKEKIMKPESREAGK